jgi:YVTN family beta-propeller protein
MDDNNVSVINGASNSVITTIAVGESPYGVGVNPQTSRIYVANSFARCVSIIDGTSNSVIDTIGAGEFPNGVGINPQTNRIYVTHFYDSCVTVIDIASDSMIDAIKVGIAPLWLDVNLQTNRIYVGNWGSDNVSVIDGAGDSVIATIGVGDRPEAVCVNPQANRIYVVNQSNDNLSVIDGAGDSVIATIGVGDYPTGACFNPMTNRIYVSCYVDGTVWVLQDETSGIEESVLNTQILNLDINPNPFNKRAEIVLNIPAGNRGENIEFSIYNVSGRLVKTFSNINNSSSQITLSWDGKADSGENLSSGLYFGVLRIGDKEAQKKMIMIK